VGLWVKETAPVVFELKAAIENLLRSLNISSYAWIAFDQKGDAFSFIYPGQSAQLLVEGKKIGFIGSLHPVLLAQEKIRVPAALAEFDLETLLKGQPRAFKVDSLSKFPRVERDLALVMPKATKVGDIVQAIKKESGEHLIDTQIFDVYEGDKLEHGKKSVAFRLIFQDKKDTLRDEVVNQATEKVLQHLKEKFGLSVR
jgi:phenylalanyl-tRNA synthetase beta chain